MAHFHKDSHEHSQIHSHENASVKTLYVCLALNIAFVAIEAVKSIK